MALTTVSYGEFNVVKNEGSKGCKVMTTDGIPAWNLPKVEWWDKDGIINGLEKDKDKILENIENKRKYFQKVA